VASADPELQQEDPEFAAADDRRGLQRQYDRGDRQQARNAPVGSLSDACGKPDRRERGQQPGVASAQPASDSVRGDGKPTASVRLHAAVRSSRIGRGSSRCPGAEPQQPPDRVVPPASVYSDPSRNVPQGRLTQCAEAGCRFRGCRGRRCRDPRLGHETLRRAPDAHGCLWRMARYPPHSPAGRISAAFAVVRSASEGGLDFICRLLDVTCGLVGASLSLEPAISGNAPGALLGSSLGRLDFVPDLLENAHGASSPSQGLCMPAVRLVTEDSWASVFAGATPF
jgi:hypothetical protein